MRSVVSVAVATLLAGTLLAQDFNVFVPNQVRQQIGRVLPERSNAMAAYVSETYPTNLTFSAATTVRIIFVREGAWYQNSLGYFTYTDNLNGSISITSADLLIGNATQPASVQRGDGFELKDANGVARTFQDGEKLGFFLIADGYAASPSIVSGWSFDYADALGSVPSHDPAINAQRGEGCYCSLSRLNPEMAEGVAAKARHMVMIKMPGVAGFLGGLDYLACGWEDLRRTGKSDDDFNDLLFVVDAGPVGALGGEPAFRYEDGDPDGDGVSGLNDVFPNDPLRASLERIPSIGQALIAFEDKYPERGDADFNDAVVAYRFDVATNQSGDITDVMGTFDLIARGAAYDASFGVHLPGLPATATGSIRIERFVSGATTSVVEPVRTVQSIIANGTRRIEDVLDSTIAMLPALPGYEFSNTLFAPGVQPAGSARLHIQFDTPVPVSSLGRPPYDAFLYVANPNYPNTRIDIHMPGWYSFADRPGYLPSEEGANTFVDPLGFPWALEVPSGWRFPMEEVIIDSAYPEFLAWRESLGSLNQQWYLNANSSTGLVGPSLAQLVPVRYWSIGIPR